MKISPEILQRLQKTLQSSYRAAVFDFDGTLTELGHVHIPNALKEALKGVPKQVPLGLCSGRHRPFLEKILRDIASSKEELKRWFFFCENGSAGYQYDSKKDQFVPFFEDHWPESAIPKEELKQKIRGHVDHAIMMPHRDYSIVVRLPWWVYLFQRKKLPIKSAMLAEKLRNLLQKEKIEKKLQILDTGIGVILIPQNNGKDRALKNWISYLQTSSKQVLVIGDQPAPGKNDEAFLSGRYGVPFTVGGWDKTLQALPVLDEQGNILQGPLGTRKLLSLIRWH